MPRNTVYSIALEDTDIVVRLNRDIIDQETLTKFLDYLELETVRKRSQLTGEQAEALAAEIDGAVWNNLKPLFTQE